MSDSSFLGTGWPYPPVFDNANFQLNLSSGTDNINQSIDLLLKTPKGSRSILVDFGSTLSHFVFRTINSIVKEEIIQAVRTTLLYGEPRIDVERVDLSVSEDGTTMQVSINYFVRQSNSRHNHVFPFSQLEGSNLEIGG